MNLRLLAAILRRKAPVANLLRELSEALFAEVRCDGMRFDLTDERGGLWSRIVKAGQDPERPALGAVARLRTREAFEVTQEEGVHQVVVPLGIGEPASGRWTLRRRSVPFSETELDAVRGIADVLSLGLRARTLEPPPKPRGPFEEGPLV
ncbi:MAG: hypothetical protein HYY16_13435 [Planctomycetes bacterium]|nr:hypothetical protein [Planctomycetota bacterium]